MKHRTIRWGALLVLLSLLFSFRDRLLAQESLMELAPEVNAPTTYWGSFDEMTYTIYVEPTYGVSFEYPDTWHVYPHFTQGRHKGFDPVLVTSFEVDFSDYGNELAIPPGEAALLIAFEGNDLSSTQELEDYVLQRLASIFYQPTGYSFEIGGKEFVELSGDTGRILITSHNANVYSVFQYLGNDQSQESVILGIIDSLKMLKDDPIYIASDALGLSSNPESLKLLQPLPHIFTVSLPSMKLPWAAGNRQFTGGPHVGVFDNTCTGLRDVSKMSGLDFGLPVGTEVLAVAGGTIVYAGDAGGTIGKAVGIDHGGNFSTRYFHLNSIDSSISVNTVVTQGSLLGTSGSAGTGAHLHLELRNWPANTYYSAHGITIDGYTVHAYVREDGQGYSYQGTMTRGDETKESMTYCSTDNVSYWTGSAGTVTAKTGGGAAVTSTNVKNIVDTTMPDTNITSGPSGWIRTREVALSWTGSDNRTSTTNLSYNYKLDDGSWSGWANNTNTTYNGLSEGAHTFYVKAKDEAGNEDGTPAVQSFSVDTVLPTQASNVRPDGWSGYYTGDTTPVFAWNAASDSGSGLAGYYVAVDDRTPDGSGGNDWWVGNVTTYNVPTPLAEGSHRFAVTSKDNAGNMNPVDGGSDAPFTTFYVDIAAPTTPKITVGGSGCSGIPNNGWQNTCNVPVFTWTSSDSGSGVKDYLYYWGTSTISTPNMLTTTTTFAPGAIAPIEGTASRYFNIIARDQLNRESGRASFVVRYDGVPPTATLAINDGAETVHQVSVWLDLTAADTGGGVSAMRFSGNGLDWTDWETYATAKAWTMPALDHRMHTVYAQVRDRAGNESDVIEDDIMLDFYPVMPSSVSYRICDDVVDVGGSVGLTSTSFSLVSAIGQPSATGAAANNSTTHTERSGFLATVDGCRPITHTVTDNYAITQWVIASGGNLRGSTSFRLGDTAGQTAASGTGAFTSTNFVLSSGFWAQITGTVPSTSTVKPTPPPPTPTPTATPGPTPTPQPSGFDISIAHDASYTNDPGVIVNTWAPNVTQMRLSNDASYVDGGWMTYALTSTWVISPNDSYVLPCPVYVWFKDNRGEIYGPYQDDIIYDPIAPQGRVRIADSEQVGATSVITLGLEASDDNSGVGLMRVGEDDLSTAAWQPYTQTITWTLQSDVVYVQFQDRAGNISSLFGSDGSEHALSNQLLSVTLSGPTTGLTATAYTFSAAVSPVTATVPITYIWQATGHAPITQANSLHASAVLSFTWDMVGTQALTVTASNSLGSATGTYSITLVGGTPTCARPLVGVTIQWPYSITPTFYVDELYTFEAAPDPIDATTPVTYTWAPSPAYGQGTSYASYRWSVPGVYTLTLAAQNCGGIPAEAQYVAIVLGAGQYHIYLPLVVRNQ